MLGSARRTQPPARVIAGYRAAPLAAQDDAERGPTHPCVSSATLATAAFPEFAEKFSHLGRFFPHGRAQM